MNEFSIPKKPKPFNMINNILHSSNISNLLQSKGYDIEKFPLRLREKVKIQERLIDDLSQNEIEKIINKNLQDKSKLVEVFEFSKVLYDNFNKNQSLISLDSNIVDEKNLRPLDMNEWKEKYPLKNIALKNFVMDLKVNEWNVSQTLQGTSRKEEYDSKYNCFSYYNVGEAKIILRID